MSPKFCEIRRKTVEIAIWKMFDDTQISVTYTISSAGCKPAAELKRRKAVCESTDWNAEGICDQVNFESGVK